MFKTGSILLISFMISAILIYVPIFLYSKFGLFKRFYHDLLGWHEPKDILSFDGCSNHSICKYCNKKIMQDGQGNWW